MSGIRLEVKPPQCKATNDGHQCERDHGHEGDHWYTAWSHPNQYGSRPSHPVRWSEPIILQMLPVEDLPGDVDGGPWNPIPTHLPHDQDYRFEEYGVSGYEL